jgi:hypothetical protein
LEQRLLSSIRQLRKVLLHAGFDPAATRLHLTAKLPNIGLASVQHGSRAGSLRHRARSAEQKGATDTQDKLQHFHPPSLSRIVIDENSLVLFVTGARFRRLTPRDGLAYHHC